MSLCPVIPVLVVEDLSAARPMAEALVRGGLRVLEVTLRTPVALEAVEVMSRVPGAVVGAGTVVRPDQADDAMRAGARFIVSPGITDRLARHLRERAPYLPGVATAGDIMRGLDQGLDHFKFFPAEAAGGLAALRALAAPFAGCRFCPTGGITIDTAARWLAFEPVLCVGGSWLGSGSMAEIETAARSACALRPSDATVAPAGGD